MRLAQHRILFIAMESAEQYISKTESAVRMLFGGIESYLLILKRNRLSGFSSRYGNDADFREKYDLWAQENEEEIQASLASQRHYLAESFAQGTLCGAILQVAAKAIECYSENEVVPHDWHDLIGPNSRAAPFCIGRDIRGVPAGLVIYAARNQHTHFEEVNLREPNVEVFRRLAANHGINSHDPFLDPAFDLERKALVSYASNCTGLLGWRNYSSYESDMRKLLNV